MRRAGLLALLLASTTAAAQRNIFLSKDPHAATPEVFVAGGKVTTLRFEASCDPSRTKLLGWEGRFEPLLMGGKSVVIVPQRNLAPGDRFMLLVTLVDGTELPFTLTADDARVDGQVDVFPDLESSTAVRKALEEERAKNEALRAENDRQHEEGASVDHALAALLANNQVKMTPFRERDHWLFTEEGLQVEISLFVPRRQVADAKDKAAVVFTVVNKDPLKPWKIQEARLSTLTTQEPLPFALRATPDVIVPGATGRVAIVTDLSSLDAKSDSLVLEIFRDGGRRQGYVVLSVKNLH